VNPSLRFLLDEQLRGMFWTAVLQHNQVSPYVLDGVRVGDTPAPPLGTLDPLLLEWSEQANRVLVSLDKRTMPAHFSAHLTTGRHSPGVLLIRPSATIAEVVAYLVLAAYAGSADEYRDTIRYIP
jgi:hypothetical protein